MPSIPVDLPWRSRARQRRHRAISRIAIGAAACAASVAHASFLSGETLDTVANAMAWIVLAIVPIIGIAVFWMVHVMPEKIAHKRHHPQQQAIQTLCLLSLVFGGLLWPIAWLWAYTRPVGYKLAYGTDKHEAYYEELGTKARSGELLGTDLAHLREELDAMDARGALSPELRKLRDDLAALQPQPAILADAERKSPVERAQPAAIAVRTEGD